MTSTIIDTLPLPISVMRRKGARRMTLRLHPIERKFTLSLPMRGSMREAERFLRDNQKWIDTQLAQLPQHVPFVPGQVLPLFGEAHQVIHQESARGVVRVEDGAIIVSGAAEHLSRRLHDWLKRKIQGEIAELAHQKASQIGARIKRITIRDTSSRWGSCSEDGKLSFSWRLIFAPHDVVDYLVAHEVAHLLEMNHSACFWAHVATLCPQWKHSRRWLRNHGSELYRYG